MIVSGSSASLSTGHHAAKPGCRSRAATSSAATQEALLVSLLTARTGNGRGAAATTVWYDQPP